MSNSSGSNVIVLGGDGFCGWPTSLHLSSLGYQVTIVDNLSRRAIDIELGADSLTPIASMEDRIAAWQDVSGKAIAFRNIDVARDYASLVALVAAVKPAAIVHFAEQRAAPYSMKDATHKRYTVDNNISATHNLLAAVAELRLDTHIVHLGTMGVYGYDGDGLTIPEGYLDVTVTAEDGDAFDRQILYPTNPGSVYHMTKSMDQLMFQYYAKNDNMRITDLHQGIVWGTQTAQTRKHIKLINRFDYDGDYGTVLNRFLMQAAVHYPLTVHGTGGQTRAFINLEDTVKCIALAMANPPARGDRVRILNQMTETYRVRDLAKIVADITGAQVAVVGNPRNEAAENDLHVSNKGLVDLGLDPITLADGLLQETLEVSTRYASRARRDVIPSQSYWTDKQMPDMDRASADVAAKHAA